MVEPPAAVVLGPVRRAIAPPGVEALGRGVEVAAEGDPVVARLELAQRLDLDRRVADDGEQLLVAPDVAFERSDVEIADHDRRASAGFRPAGHPLEEVELLAELGIDLAIGDVAAGGDIDVL